MRLKATCGLVYWAAFVCGAQLLGTMLYLWVPAVRCFVAKEARLYGSAALPLYRHLLADHEPEVRAAAAFWVRHAGPDALPLLRAALADDVPAVRHFAVGSLSSPQVGAAGVPDLIRTLADSRVDMRQAAAHGLGFLDRAAKDAIPALIEALRDPDAEVRQKAVVALSSMGKDARAAVPALMACLRDPDPEVRLRAVIAVVPDEGEETTSSVVGALGALLRHDPDAGVRRQAGQCLAFLGPAAVPALKRALDDPDVDVRRAATVALELLAEANQPRSQ